LAYPELGNDFLGAFERMVEHKPIYGEVSREFIPLIYFPGIFVAVRLWSCIFGFSVSSVLAFYLVLIVITLAMIWLLARLAGCGRKEAVLAPIIWMGFTGSGVVTPLAIGPDTLMVALVLAGVTCLAAGNSWRWLFGGGAFFSAAALTKQNMAPLALLPTLLALVLNRSFRDFIVTLIPPAVAGILAVIADRMLGGHMFEVTLGSVAGHPFTTREWASKLSLMVLGLGTPCLALALMAAAFHPKTEWRQPQAAGPALALLFLMVVGYAGHMKLGGGPPHLQPFYTLLIPLSLGRGSRALRGTFPVQGPVIWMILSVLQLGRCLYEPRTFVDALKMAYERQMQLLEYFKSVDGPVLYASDTQCYLVRHAGKPPVFSRNQLHGLLYGGSTRGLDEHGLPPDMTKALRQHYYAAVVYEVPTLANCPLLAAVRKYYVLEGRWPGPGYDVGVPLALSALTSKEIYRRPTASDHPSTPPSVSTKPAASDG